MNESAQGGASQSLQSKEIGGDATATIYYVEGETWAQAIANHSSENGGWWVQGGEVRHGYCYLYVEGGGPVDQNATINTNGTYSLNE